MNEMENNCPERVEQLLAYAGVSAFPVEISLLTEASPKVRSLVQHLRDPAIRNTDPAVVFCSPPLRRAHAAIE